MFNKVMVVMKQVLEFLLLLLGIAILLQVIFGAVVPFIQLDIIGSITRIIASLGSQGFVGLIGLLIVIYLVNKGKQS